MWPPLPLTLLVVGAMGWIAPPPCGSPPRRAPFTPRAAAAAAAEDLLLASAAKLHLLLHVPAGAFPDAEAQARLRACGVRAIVAGRERGATATTGLPIIDDDDAPDEALAVDGRRWLWLRGDRTALLERAAALPSPKPGYIASLPSGGAASESALRRSSTLAWQLHTTHRCRAIVLSWPELEAAADAEGGWEAVVTQLNRMRNPTWTVIQGG